MEKIQTELESCNAYIYNQREFRSLDFAINEHLEDINYVLENCDERNTF